MGNKQKTLSKVEVYVQLLSKKESKLALWLIEERKRPSLKQLFLIYRAKKQLPKSALYKKIFDLPYSKDKDVKLRQECSLLIKTIMPVYGFFGEIHPMKESTPVYVLLDRMANSGFLTLFESEIKKAIADALAVHDFKRAGLLYSIWLTKNILYQNINKNVHERILTIAEKGKQAHIKNLALQVRQIEADEAYSYSHFKDKLKADNKKFLQLQSINLDKESNNSPASKMIFYLTNNYILNKNSTNDLINALDYAKLSKQPDKERKIIMITAFLALTYHKKEQLIKAINYYEQALEKPDLHVHSNFQILVYALVLAYLQNGQINNAHAILIDDISKFKLALHKKELLTLKILTLCIQGNFKEAVEIFPKDLKADFDSWYYQQNRLLLALIWFETGKKELAYNEIELLAKHFSYIKNVDAKIKNEYVLLKKYIKWQDAINKDDKNAYLKKLQETQFKFVNDANPIHIFVNHALKKNKGLHSLVR